MRDALGFNKRMANLIPKQFVPEKVLKFWNKNRVWILLGFFLLAILLGYFLRDKSTGTWDTMYYYKPKKKKKVTFKGADYVDRSEKDSKGEIACRAALKRIFNRPFDKCRPDFLRNVVTGNKYNLEIDCYDADLKIGVEYQGRQHYEFVPYMHNNNYAVFLNQKYRDELKRMKCKENGVLLIEVPHKVKEADIETFLRKELAKNGVKVPI